MKKLISNSIKVNIVLLGLFPIMPHIVNAVTTASFFILSTLLYITSKIKLEKSKLLLINSSLYLTYLVSLIYTSNFDYATKHLLTALSLGVLPLAFYFLNSTNFLKKDEIKALFLKIFWSASAVYSFIVYISFLTFSNPRYPFKDANFFRNASTTLPLIDQHPIYSSIILSLAVLIGIHFLFVTKNKKIKLFIGLVQIIMIILLIMLMSKGVILALILGAIILFNFQLKKTSPIKISYTIIFSFFVLILVYVAIPQKNNRFLQLFNEITYSNLNENNSTSIRMNIYKCAWEKIKKAPLLGYGFGDVKDELVLCYKSKSPFMVKNLYNSHNQYLSVFLGMGILGLIIFLYMLFYNLRIALLASDYLGFSIIILFCVILFFENILERQTGVILFTFFINLFGHINLKK